MSCKDESINDDGVTSEPPRRLCSEIQLFDLCELERCHFKDGRFCTDVEMLARFESVAEPQDRPVRNFDTDEDDEEYSEELEEDDMESDFFDDDEQQEQDDRW